MSHGSEKLSVGGHNESRGPTPAERVQTPAESIKRMSTGMAERGPTPADRMYTPTDSIKKGSTGFADSRSHTPADRAYTPGDRSYTPADSVKTKASSHADSRSHTTAERSQTPADSLKSLNTSSNQWSKKCEVAVNKQINMELHAGYSYLSLAQFFGRSDVGLTNVSNFFWKCEKEEKEHALGFIKYQNKRGGLVCFAPIQPLGIPLTTATFTLLKAFEKALELEKEVTENLYRLLETAEHDPHLQEFISSNYLTEQADALEELQKYITNIKRCVPGTVGEFLFDKHFNN